jgi:hypothetical protein
VPGSARKPLPRHWVKRREACAYASIGKTKLDQLIGRGLIEARKEGDSPQAAVFVYVPSIDKYIRGLGKAPGSRPAAGEVSAQA